MALRLSAVRKTFGQPPTDALQGVTLSIDDGELVAITGRSGSGKSTLLYIMSTLDRPSAGAVEIAGRDATAMTSRESHRFRNLNLGFVFQFHHLLPELTALENVLMPAVKWGHVAARRERAQGLLAEFGLRDKLQRLPNQLSGGEQQRVAIARALVMRPRYVFADEPTGNLDTVNGDLVMKLLLRANAEGATVVFVTHDPDFAKLARRRVNLVDGRVRD